MFTVQTKNCANAAVSPTDPPAPCATLAAFEKQWRDALDAYGAAKRAALSRCDIAIESVTATLDELCRLSRLLDTHQLEHGCGLRSRSRKAPAESTGV